MKNFKDEAITQLIISRLKQDQRTWGQSIDVVVKNGKVYLYGACDNEEQRIAAGSIVKGMCGVQGVVDQLIVRDDGIASAV